MITETAKPEKYMVKIKWIERYPTFIKFLRYIPGRNVILLSYICRPVSAIVPTTGYRKIIDEYLDKVPLKDKRTSPMMWKYILTSLSPHWVIQWQMPRL